MILSQEYKKKHYFFLSRKLVVCFLISITLNNTYAQVQRGKKDDAKAELISFKDRWGIKTNAVDWLLTVPNIGVEFDLGNTIRNKRTIGANIKWNWNTSQKYTPSLIFNVFDARVEWRQYFRTRKRGGVTKDANLMTRLKETVFTTQHKNPRQERAYYWGVYVNAASYNFKIGKEGKQGNAYGAGISVGYTAPLYGYRNNYIDLELGGSAGLLYTSYDVYTHDAESDCYPRIAEKCKSGHIVPFPLITDLRVAFVYRFMSAGSKYKESVYRRVQIRDFARQALNEKINKMRERIDSINNAVRKQGFSRPDSLLTKILPNVANVLPMPRKPNCIPRKRKKRKIKTPGKTGKKTESRKREPPTKKREMLPVKKKMKRRIKDEEQDTDIPCPQPAVLHLCLHLGRPLSGSGTSAHHRHACTAQLGRHQQR